MFFNTFLIFRYIINFSPYKLTAWSTASCLPCTQRFVYKIVRSAVFIWLQSKLPRELICKWLCENAILKLLHGHLGKKPRGSFSTSWYLFPATVLSLLSYTYYAILRWCWRLKLGGMLTVSSDSSGTCRRFGRWHFLHVKFTL